MAVASNLSPAQARANYLSQAVKRSQELPPQIHQANGVFNFSFPHAGIGRYALVSFVGTLTRTEVAVVGTLTASPFYPLNVLSRVLLTDYTGTTRVNAKPYDLYQRQILQNPSFDPAVADLSAQAYAANVWAAAMPATPAENNSTTSPLIYSFKVPISLHEDTTEGSLPFAIPDGEVTLQLQGNSLIGSTIDSPFMVTGTTTASITGTYYVTYHYFDAPNNVPLPLADFGVIHEIISTRQNTNIAAGQEKLFTLETGRTYYQLIQTFVANNAPNTLDISRLKFLVDGNTPTMDEYQLSYLTRIRETLKRDLAPGVISFNFFSRPWSPASYGSLAASLTLTPTITLGTAYWLDTMKETMYRATSALQMAG